MSKRAIFKGYVEIQRASSGSLGKLQVHYRESGNGFPVLLLHPSPLSSKFMEPLIKLFSHHSRAIAWDTPGYGQSDQLPHRESSLSPYVSALHDFISALNLDRPIIYGSATGAQIAIEYGRAFPELTRGLILENTAWFFDEEREKMMSSYFPSLEPKENGSHLQLAWQMATQLYRHFPWYDQSIDTLINEEGAPLELVHQTAMHYLISWRGYDDAYRAAFFNEKPEPLQELSVPTRLVMWSGSLLAKYSNRLKDIELPNNVTIEPVLGDNNDRFDKLETLLTQMLPTREYSGGLNPPPTQEKGTT